MRARAALWESWLVIQLGDEGGRRNHMGWLAFFRCFRVFCDSSGLSKVRVRSVVAATALAAFGAGSSSSAQEVDKRVSDSSMQLFTVEKADVLRRREIILGEG